MPIGHLLPFNKSTSLHLPSPQKALFIGPNKSVCSQERAEGNNSGMTEWVLSDNAIVALPNVSKFNYSLKAVLHTHFAETSEISLPNIIVPIEAYAM